LDLAIHFGARILIGSKGGIVVLEAGVLACKADVLQNRKWRIGHAS
jgi:hypothetical protein